MQFISKSIVTVLCFSLIFVSASAAGAEPELLPDSECPDVQQAHYAATLHVKLLRMSALGSCYDIEVPAGFIGVASLKTVSGDPKPAVSLLRYGLGLVKQDRGGARQRAMFGELTASNWYQVRIDHYGLFGEVELHLYRVDVIQAAFRGAAWGFGQALAEEGINALAYQACLILASADTCGQPAGMQFREDMVSRGVTLTVSSLQQQSLSGMTRDMALNEASIWVRSQFGGGGGHTMTIMMAIASEIIDGIYAW
jgi:hypothetical protein